MALPNPAYVGQNAIHPASVIRLMAYGITAGQRGVFGPFDCEIKALETPGAQIQGMPGGYSVPAKHLGGSYESYDGKWDVAEVVDVSPVDSGGPRSDLVVLRMEDPYVSGAGSWVVPADPELGPYIHLRVLENVPADTTDVSQVNSTWSAITLARIDRDASTGIVEQADIVDLRSIAQLGGTRTVVQQVNPPPIAQASYVQFAASASDPGYANPVGGTDTVHDFLDADTATKDWPIAATYQVPVPEWAVECDAEFMIYNAQILVGDVYGDMWLDFGGVATPSQTYAVDYNDVPGRHNIGYGTTFTVPSSLRGDLITVRTKFASRFSAGGKLDAKTGVTTKLALNFQRVPDAS